MKKILVAGQVCLDITPVFNEEFSGTSPSDLFIPGQLIMVDSTKFCGGGCVSNTGRTGAEDSGLQDSSCRWETDR